MSEKPLLPDVIRKNRKWVALGIFIFVLVVLVISAPHIGLTWDEPDYIAATEDYMSWFKILFTKGPARAFSQQMIDVFWSTNHEHPPLAKIWAGVFWALGRNVFNFNDLLAHRLGNIVLVAIMMALLYKMVSEAYGDFAGLGAVMALLFMPRFFFHSNLTALDIPATFVVFWVIYLFWKTVDNPSFKTTLFLILASGLAIATKVNAFFIFPALLLWVLIFKRSWNLVIRLFIMGFVGLLLSFVFWPWVYHDTISRIVEYFLFITVNHWDIGVYYLGDFHMPPPWHYVFVVTYAVVPLATLILAVVGAVRATRRKYENTAFGWLIIINVLTPMLALSNGTSMIYDGERLFMPAFPYIAALAGIGLWVFVRWLLDFATARGWKLKQIWVTVAAVVAVFIVPLITTVQLYPHLLSYYSYGVGGLWGANKMGLEATYWCESFETAIEYINERAEPGDSVWVEPWSTDVLVYYSLQGVLRYDLEIGFTPKYADSIFGDTATFGAPEQVATADYIIFQNRPTQFYSGEQDKLSATWVETHTPAFQVSYQGVPIVEVFENK